MFKSMQKMNDAWTENLKDWTDESLERQDAVGPAHNGRGLGPADIEAVRTEMRRRGLQPRGPGTRGPGRPRTVTKPGDPPGTGNPMFRIRRDLAERVRAMGPGYLDRLIEADIAREGNMVASAPIEVDNSNPGHSYARFVLMFYGSRLISVKEPGLDRLTEADIAAETDRP